MVEFPGDGNPFAKLSPNLPLLRSIIQLLWGEEAKREAMYQSVMGGGNQLDTIVNRCGSRRGGGCGMRHVGI